MVYTLGLETLSKEAILALYLNSIEFGTESMVSPKPAINTSSKNRVLTVKEAVFLASITIRSGYRRPSAASTHRREPGDLAELVDGRHITRKAMNDAMQKPLRLLLR